MKILAICTAMDLRYKFGCTPAWWQLFKGLYEEGIEVIAIPYFGAPIEAPWWRAYPNPIEWEGRAFLQMKVMMKKALGKDSLPARNVTWQDETTLWLANHFIMPRWEKHIRRILERDKDIDAIMMLGVPVNHISGLASRIKARYDMPFFYYDGDVPGSLPQYTGYEMGLNMYYGANLSEYDGVISNSEGGVDDLLKLGAKSVKVLFWGVDTDLFAPREVNQDIDVFFYGFGCKYRAEWIEKMISRPSGDLPDKRFVVGGKNFRVPLDKAHRVEDVPLNVFSGYCNRSKINLNIPRSSHASVYASSSCRIFELASMGCCIVSSPYQGIEKWLEPEKEVIVIDSATNIQKLYTTLLSNEKKRRLMGQRARKRVLAQHSVRMRARELLAFVDECTGIN